MNPILLALALIVSGLILCWLCEKVKFALLSLVVFWAGIIVVVLGLVILLFPVIAWLYRQLTSMFGIGP